MSDKRRGHIVATVLFAMAVLIGMAALSIDYGLAVLAKQQLQTSVDAAALAAVGTLQVSLDPDAAAQAAMETASQNQVLGDGLTLAESDITVGAWNEEDETIEPFEWYNGVYIVPDGVVAVRVDGRRTQDAPDGSVPLHFAKVLGVSSIDLTAQCTAALTIAKHPRPPVEVMLVQDQSGSFEDEFPYAREGNVEFVDFMRRCFADDDKIGICGFGQHAYHEFMDSRARMDTNLFHDVHPDDTYETDKYETGPDEYSDPLSDYIAAMPTVPYNQAPEHNSWTNMYTGLLRAGVAFADPDEAAAKWQEFIDHFWEENWWESASSSNAYRKGTRYQWEPYRSDHRSYYSRTRWFDGKKYGRIHTKQWVHKDIGYYWRNGGSTKKSQLEGWIDDLLDYDFANGDAEHVVVLISDGIPWWAGAGGGDYKIKQLGSYVADALAEKGIRIHTVTLDQGDGSDSQYNASLCRNGGYAFYTYDADRLKTLMVGVGQVEVGSAHLIH